MPARRHAAARRSRSTRGNQQTDFKQGRRERRPVQTHEDAATGGDRMRQRASERWANARMNKRKVSAARLLQHVQEVGTKNSRWWSALQGAERHAKSVARAADAGYRDCSCRGAEREAESLACKCTLARLPRKLMPNPSFKPSPNGGPPGPVWRYAVHFRQSGPGVPPSVPA